MILEYGTVSDSCTQREMFDRYETLCDRFLSLVTADAEYDVFETVTKPLPAGPSQPILPFSSRSPEN